MLTRGLDLGRHNFAPAMGICHIIPLGGLGEVGKNMTAYEAEVRS